MDHGDTGTVKETSVNVRRPAKAQAPADGVVIGFLPFGATVTVVNDFGDGWPFIQAGTGASEIAGYIDASNVDWKNQIGGGSQKNPPPPQTDGIPGGLGSVGPALLDLVSIYAGANIDYPKLRAITLAQWILESDWGRSILATTYNNFGGLKYRDEMAKFATKISYQASDGVDFYCAFKSRADFIIGYWQFLSRDVYDGWRDRTSTPETFINFIGPLYCPTAGYVQAVLKNLGVAQGLLDNAARSDTGDTHHNDGNPIAKPVPEPSHTRYKSSREGAKIDHIVIHYTESRNLDGTIATFTNDHLDHQRSAHYAIGRDGRIVQFVDDSLNAWHAGDRDMNHRSIGIEHSAAPGDQITLEQQNTSIQLIRWLVHEYNIPLANIIPHHSVLSSTPCPAQLLSAYDADPAQAVTKWIKKNF